MTDERAPHEGAGGDGNGMGAAGTDDLPEMASLPPELRAALVPDAVRARTRARLLARAASEDRGSTAAPALPASPATPTPAAVAPALRLEPGGAAPVTVRRTGVPTPLFAAAVFGLAASLVFVVRLANERTAVRSALANSEAVSVAQQDSLQALQSLLGEREALVASLTGKDVVVVGLASTQSADPRALMFWDQARDRWTFVAHNLPTLAIGRTYQLWLVTDNAQISAGTFRASANGEAVVEATYALDRSALRAVAVTEEVEGGVDAPTGPMIVVGSAATL